jgi:NDP-sugar pyrophosphorylase family protein
LLLPYAAAKTAVSHGPGEFDLTMSATVTRPRVGAGMAPSLDLASVRGVVLAGTYHWSGSSFEALLPRPLLPVAQAPLVSYALRWLRDGGVANATVCANSASRAVRSYLGKGNRLSMSIAYHEDWTPRGAAGCVRDAAASTDAQTLVIADGTAIPSVNIGLLLADHRSSRAAVTIVVHRDRLARAGERPLNPGGIYVFDRRALDYINETGFQDIKETLIPRLSKAGERIVTHAGLGVCPRVLNAETYLAVNHWMIEQMSTDPSPLEHWGIYFETGQLIAHPTASVHPEARIIGPVLLGPHVRVGAEATIVGPVSLGAGCEVEEGALVSRSVAWERVSFGAGAAVDHGVLADDAIVAPGERLLHALKVAGSDPRRSLWEPLPEPLPEPLLGPGSAEAAPALVLSGAHRATAASSEP